MNFEGIKKNKEQSASELAEQLVKRIRGEKKEFFRGITVVVPELRTAQWFRAYWLKTQADVLMNVRFETVDDFLAKLAVTEEPCELIGRKQLKMLIMKKLMEAYANRDKDYAEICAYLKPIGAVDAGAGPDANKLYDVSDLLAQLFIEYDIECVWDDAFREENNENYKWEKSLYEAVIEEADQRQLGTLRSMLIKSGFKVRKLTDSICFFGFLDFSPIQKKYIEAYYNLDSSIEIYCLDEKDCKERPDELIKAPSKLREIEAIHSEICKKLLDTSDRFCDFLVLAPDISIYESEIRRVFRQDNDKFPDIPFSVNDHKMMMNDVAQTVHLLEDIRRNGFYTRTDFFAIVGSPSVRVARGITEDDLSVWKKAVTAMNVYRKNGYGDDWEYAKTRMLLSKMVDNYEKHESGILLKTSGTEKEEEFIPYTDLDLKDDSIVRFASAVDDLKDWLNAEPKMQFIREELDKWFSVPGTDGEEKNYRYRKLLDVCNWWADFGLSDDIPEGTLFRILEEAGVTAFVNCGEFFTQGVTFADLSENAPVSVQNLFIIGAGSDALCFKGGKSELDIREDPVKSKRERMEKALKAQLSDTETLSVSYVYKDLKADEDFYLSPEIKNCFSNIQGEKEIKKISIDETRGYSELFTKGEYRKKQYYNSLLSMGENESGLNDRNAANNDSDNPQAGGETGIRQYGEQIEIKASELSKYLIEPLVQKYKTKFGWKDEQEQDIRQSYEPIEESNLINSTIVKNGIVKEYKRRKNNPSIHDDEVGYIREEISRFAKWNHSLPDALPDNAQSLSESIIEVVDYVTEAYTLEETRTEVVIPMNPTTDLSAAQLGADPKRIVLENDIVYFKKAESGSNDCSYIEVKSFKSGNVSNSDYIPLYIASLADVASKEETSGSYKVSLIRNKATGTKNYEVSPESAKRIIRDIVERRVINDSPWISVDAVDKEYHSVDDMADAYDNPYDYSFGWKYFKDKNVIDPETQLGYSDDMFLRKNSQENLFERMCKETKNLVLFLLPREQKDNQ